MRAAVLAVALVARLLCSASAHTASGEGARRDVVSPPGDRE